MAELDPRQRQMLQMYRAWRSRPPTVRSVLLRPRYLGSLLLTAVFAAAWLWAVDLVWGRPVVVFIAGMLFGVLVRDWRAAVRAERFWPWMEEVLDWPKIERLLGSECRTSPETGNPYQSPTT
jgi:hypothetical protein